MSVKFVSFLSNPGPLLKIHEYTASSTPTPKIFGPGPRAILLEICKYTPSPLCCWDLVKKYEENMRKYGENMKRRNFLGEPKNKDHVSCFSISGGRVGIFPSPRAYIEGENVYHYELTCWMLTAPRPTAVSLRGEFGAYMEEKGGVTTRNRL